MKPTPGARVGPYEMLAPLGQGGMGEVWRARDVTLGREVAIKYLPEAFAEDPDRLARFDREARLLAALNHPGIAAVYGFHNESGSRFLAMELLAGEDLSVRLSRAPIPIDEALEIARQVAEALEAAHEQGIVHRDLKPANIMLVPDGRAKVLDFGLAKGLESAAASGVRSADPSLSPTVTSLGTVAGVIVGTAAYMSPEQARGRGADRRSDVWGLGCVLYEMLSGRQPYDGETISDRLAAILAKEPDWGAVPDSVPESTRRLVRRCLIKDARQRVQSMGEVRITLEEAIRERRDGPAPAVAAAGVPSPARSVSRLVLAAGLLLAATVGSAGTWLALSGDPTSSRGPLRKFAVMVSLAVESEANRRSVEISPDGTRVIYVTEDRIFVRDLSELEPRPLTGTEGARAPFWSPDGELIAYQLRDKLMRIPAAGGAPVEICTIPGVFGGGAWGPGGRIVLSLIRGPMMEVPAGGGTPKVLLPLEGEDEIDFHQPSFMPDGRTILTALHRRQGVDTLLAVDGVRRQVLLRSEQATIRSSPQVLNAPVWSPTGHLLFQRDQGNIGIWALPVDPASLEASGEPFILAPGAANASLSVDGTLVYRIRENLGPSQLVRSGGSSGREEAVGPLRLGMRGISVSPDGRRAIVGIQEGESGDLWIVELASATFRQLTFTPENEGAPIWIDNERVAFTCATAEGSALCAARADGTGTTERLAEHATAASVSSDGRWLVYQAMGMKLRGILALDLRTPSEPIEFVKIDYDVWSPQISPDGRWVVYSSLEGGRQAVYVKPFPTGDGKWSLPDEDAAEARWSRDSRRLIYRDADGDLHTVAWSPTGGFPPQEPVRVTRGLSSGLGGIVNFDSSPVDDQVFFLRSDSATREQPAFVVVQNWFEEFRAP